ncbi:MAG: penicillin-binding protein activator [Myxococcota bacterium]
MAWHGHLFLLCALSCVGPACSGGGSQQKAAPGPQQGGTSAAQTMDAAITAEREGRLTEALALYSAVFTQTPNAVEAPDALLAHAALATRLQQREAARRSLEELALRHPTHPAAKKAKLLLASMDLQEGRTNEGISAMRSAYQQLPPGEERTRAAKELGATLANAGENAGAVAFLAEAETTATTPEQKEALRAQLLEIIDGNLAATDVLALRETLPAGSYAHTLLTLKLARIYLHLGDDARAKEAFQAFLAADPQSPYAPLAQVAITAIDQRSLVATRKLGVVLPMSGKYEQAGNRMLTALKLGLDAAMAEAIAKGQTTPPPAPVEVVVKDDRGEPEDAAKAVDELVQQDRVMAVVGAITVQGSKDAAIRAEAARVPLMTMARREGLAEMGPYTFHFGLTDEKQARAVARLAAEILGFKRVALLYPRLPKGVSLINAFWDTFESLGGQIAGAETYDHDETTFTVPVRKLVGRHYLEARGEYIVCKAKAKEIEQAYKRQKAEEQCKDTVTPVVDFDAIFIADYHGPVGLIAPALAFEDVFVGNDERAFRQFKQTTGRANARRVQLLGTNGFNDRSLPTRGGKYVQGALFVDGFNPQDGRPETEAFIKAYVAATGSKPELREAQAYDAGRILGLIYATNPQTRTEFRDRLSGVKDFTGVTGVTSFDAQGSSVTPLHVFTIKGENIIPAVLERRAGG